MRGFIMASNPRVYQLLMLCVIWLCLLLSLRGANGHEPKHRFPLPNAPIVNVFHEPADVCPTPPSLPRYRANARESPSPLPVSPVSRSVKPVSKKPMSTLRH
jgi:hypothetical protein